MHILYTIMLQAAGAASDPLTVWQLLADKGLTLAILGVIAWVLWRRQKDLEDRLTNYLNEDRKNMLSVIENNTHVMERNNDLVENLLRKNGS